MKALNNSFEWVTGEPWSFASWLQGEPSSGLWEPYLNYLGPQGTQQSSPTWNDTDGLLPPGVQSLKVVLEWSADCNTDGVVDYGQILDGSLSDANGNFIPDACEFGGCAGDVTGDSAVNGDDLAIVLSSWGSDPPKGGGVGPGDVNGDGTVDGADLAVVLGSWGPCN